MSYWDRRESDLLYASALEVIEEELGKEYVRCYRKTYQQMVDLYYELMNTDGEILISDLYKFNRYYELMNNLNENLTKLGINEKVIIETTLTNFYLENSELIGNNINWLMPINDEVVKKAINSVWCSDGKHFSERIWTNMSLLEERIKDGLVDCVARGASKDELVKQLMKDFNVGYRQADRIARTELSYIQNKSTLDKYEQAGLEKYEVLASQADDEVCGDLDGKQFYLHEAQVGVNFPPFHPNCKCCILAVL